MPEGVNLGESRNLALIGFGSLDKIEIKKVNKIIATRIKKLNTKIDYELLRIRLKTHQRNKIFRHELRAELLIRPGDVVGSSTEHKNLYKALDDIMRKLITEIEHKINKTRR